MAKVQINFYADDERDADVLAWLAQQGNRSAAIRQAIRASLAGGDGVLPAAGLDAATLRRVLREELAHMVLGPVKPSTANTEDDELRQAMEDLVGAWDFVEEGNDR